MLNKVVFRSILISRHIQVGLSLALKYWLAQLPQCRNVLGLLSEIHVGFKLTALYWRHVYTQR